MSHSELCPVCNGKGKTFDNECTAPTKQCHSCNGLGWITVYKPVMLSQSIVIYEYPVRDPWFGTTWETGAVVDRRSDCSRSY